MEIKIKITEKLEKEFTIYADTVEEALEIAKENYRKVEVGYVLSSEDHTTTEYEVLKKGENDE